MRFWGLFLCAACLSHVFGADRPTPVIVELFTSEGCSSCPPADRLLARLDQTQPVSGAEVIPIEEHVDYWNQLGWVDPFSSPEYRMRQNDYAIAFHVDDIYTPQMVVNGVVEFVGSDAGRAYHEIRNAAQSETTQIELSVAPNAKDAGLMDLTLRFSNPKTAQLHDSNVYLAITENNLSNFVRRGENAGHTLRHSAVVRSFGVIGRIDPKGASGGQLVSTLRLPPEWNHENLRAVVFVQEKKSLRITGANEIDLH
ncbi:MAG TPA: DUF1223 domain-containing protein [Bryobacteraceae bacterium]|nr:DUF1223 domain-containing protein [Bryobacteraceae bacterium]